MALPASFGVGSFERASSAVVSSVTVSSATLGVKLHGMLSWCRRQGRCQSQSRHRCWGRRRSQSNILGYKHQGKRRGYQSAK